MERSFLCFVATIALVTYVSHASNSIKIELPVQEGRECTRPGFICEDCSVSNLCYQQANGTWVKEFVEDCSLTQQTCRESTGTCTPEVNEPCTSVSEVDFRCNDIGVFPDPYNCTEYHMCVRGPNDTIVRFTEFCPDGVYFDPLTLRCSLRNVDSCPQPVPTCRQVSQGAVADNPRMYYICVPSTTPTGQRIYSPNLYYCPGSYIYLKSICFDPTTPLGVVNNTCNIVGSLYHPNCGQYNFCSSVGAAPSTRTCVSTAYFNTTQEACVSYECSTLRPK